MEEKYKMLALAIEIATEAHKGQFDKGGKPYILHPLHLMSQLMFDIELATIAVLHDVIEDSEKTLVTLGDYGFNGRVLSALHLLTRQSENTYEEYINRISNSPDAIKVKRKDLQHNSDITRLKGVKEKDFARMEKYHKAFVFLGEAKREFTV